LKKKDKQGGGRILHRADVINGQVRKPNVARGLSCAQARYTKWDEGA